MLRVHTTKSAAHAKHYYTEALKREDYYTRASAQEILGTWHGQGAARLGLSGAITREAFLALLDNQRPDTGAQLTPRMDEHRRPGFDCTFSAPKSVALLYAFGSAEQRASLMDAFQGALQDTMGEMEHAAAARVRKNGARDARTTGNLVWGDFLHLSARPVDGRADIDLHAHCYVLNATYDAVETQWKALEPGHIWRDAAYYEAAFHARLALAVKALGLEIERRGKFWDVRGIPRSVIDKSSRRSREIDAAAAALGITDAQAKGALGARTRANKVTDLPYDTLVQRTWDALEPQEQRAVREVLARAEQRAAPTEHAEPHAEPAERAEPLFSERMADAFDHAVLACFERHSVVSETQFLEAMLRYGTGHITPEDAQVYVRVAVGGSPRLLHRDVAGQRMVTTPDVLAEEQALLAVAQAGRGQCLPFALRPPDLRATALNLEQQAAARHILSSWDRVMIVQGGAGTGKTRSMQAIIPAIEQQAGKQVFVFAPFVETTKTLQADGFHETQTVEHMLRNTALQDRMHNQVLFIDEAGLLSVRDMRRVFDVAERLHARVILVGDTRQHRAVQRGDAFRLLLTQGGLRTAEVTAIVRQRGAYKDVATLFAQGDTLAGFDKADALGWVKEAPDDVRYTLIGQDYAWYTNAGKSVLVVAPTHAEGRKVTEAIREVLRQEGRLGATDRDLATLRALQWGEAQKRDAAQYRPGLVVQFEQHVAGFARGQRVTVSRVAGGQVWAHDPAGHERAVPLDKAPHFALYTTETLPLAEGERVRITHAGTSLDGHRLINGATYRVQGWTKDGHLVLDNGWTVAHDFAHLASGYYTTSYAAQGKTVDRVLIAQGAAAYAATNREQAYVSATRGKDGMAIYTDDKAALREYLTHSSHRGTATELLYGAVPAKAITLEAAHARHLRRLAGQYSQEAGAATETPGHQIGERTYERRQHPPLQPDRHPER